MKTVTAVSLGIATVAAAGIIVILGWKLHWWFYKANLQQRYEGNVTSQEYQGAMVAADPGQIKAEELTFCTTYSKLTPVSLNANPDLVAAAAKYCPPS